MIDVTAIGEYLIDFTEYGIGDDDSCLFWKNAGGAPANLLVAVSRFGGKTAFITKVGNDMLGEWLVSILKQNGVMTEGVVRDEYHNTTLAFVELDKHGDRSFSFCRKFGADIFLTAAEVNTDLIKHSKIFHFGSLSLTDEPALSATKYALEAAVEAGCIITFDPNYRSALWNDEQTAFEKIRQYIKYVQILKVSHEEARIICGIEQPEKAADKILQMGPQIVLVTDGANGVYFASEILSGHLPSFRVKTVDTTGAGDIFFGVFIASFLKVGKKCAALTPEELKWCIERSVKAAGMSTAKKGAIRSIPSMKEVDD